MSNRSFCMSIIMVSKNRNLSPRWLQSTPTIKKLQTAKDYRYWHKGEILFYRVTRSFTCREKIRQNYVEVFRLLVTHLKSKLPLESTILKNCVYTHPRKKGDKKGLSAISKLTIELSKPLEGALSKVFPTWSTNEEVYDKVRTDGGFVRWGTSRVYVHNRHHWEVKWQKLKQTTTIVLGESLSTCWSPSYVRS